MNRRILCLMILTGVLSLGRWSVAAEIEFRLVPYDRPDITVDSLEKREPILNPVQTARGVEVETIGPDADPALAALLALIADKFGEGE